MISAAKILKKFKNIESPNMVSKQLYGHYLRSYEQIKKNRILITILRQLHKKKNRYKNWVLARELKFELFAEKLLSLD